MTSREPWFILALLATDLIVLVWWLWHTRDRSTPKKVTYYISWFNNSNKLLIDAGRDMVSIRRTRPLLHVEDGGRPR